MQKTDDTLIQALQPSSATADAPAPAADPLWFKDAVIYELHIKAFADANGDGIGDFAGLIDKLDHVRDLGVNTIWLLPFYPSPLRDDGYDVADFTSVHPQYGSTEDVARLVAEAHRRGLRVITELVVNHTSDQHPWFQRARRAPKGSPERDWYVWSDDPTRYAGTRIIFTDTETSNWTWDPVAGQYFWHRFFSHQPDLNFDNPAVRAAVFEVMEFWLQQGVDGFRLDAIPYLIEREGTSNENLRETHQVIKELRARLDARWPGKLLLAEANMWPEDVREYFGDDDECHMAYHFPLMPRMYMAMAQEDRHPVVDILKQTPEISPNCQWAIFLRNHDELTLEMVTSKERDYMWSMYAAEPRARINLGIRRRLAPLLGNDRQRIQLMNSLLLSMPGSPVLYYGDEIGMGDNIFLGDRDGVRTPMQWTSDRNGGFSRADPQRLYLPPIQDPVYGFAAVNVETQLRDASSLLHWTRRLLATRRSTRVFGRGSIHMLHPGNRKVLAYVRELGDEAVLCVANLARTPQPVELDLARFKGRVPVEMSGHVPFVPIGDQPYTLTLPGHGFLWFRLATDVAPPEWHSRREPVDDLAVLVLFDGWNSLFSDRVVPWRMGLAGKTLAEFEGALLPRFLARQPWWSGDRLPAPAAPAQPAPAQVREHAVLSHAGREWLLLMLQPRDGGAVQRWWLPLALAWEDADDLRMRVLAPAALAKVRQQASVGLLGDAAADPEFCRALVHGLLEDRVLPASQGRLRFHGTGALPELARDQPPAEGLLQVPAPAGRPRHHSALRWGEHLFIKLLRPLQPGSSPEVELQRFLQAHACGANVAPLAGWLEHEAADGSISTLAVVQAWVHNQGTFWMLLVDSLARYLDDDGQADVPPAAAAETGPGAGAMVLGGALAAAQAIGTRLAELHAALARRTGDSAFDPEPVAVADHQAWATATRQRAAATLHSLRAQPASASPARAALAAQLADALRAGGAVERVVAAGAQAPAGGWRTRIHGQLRLHELLNVHGDAFFVDFEGDPLRPLAERRRKESPWRDVASLLCSLSQARLAALQRGQHADIAPQRHQALVRLARQWGASMRDALLQSYTQRALALGQPVEASGAQALLALFELDCALQDVLEAQQRGDPGDPGEHATQGMLLAMGALADLLDAH